MITYPELMCDGYKIDHIHQYLKETQIIGSNLTARGTRRKNVNKVVFFGLQYFIKEYLIKQWNENFFSKPKEEVLARFQRRINNYLGPNQVGVSHIAALHDLGYLPISIRALPEGSVYSLRIPSLFIVNTKDEFFWVTNYLETILSTTIWGPCTSATTAFEYKKILTKYALKTVGDTGFVQWQGHDFSFRGMYGFEAALMSGGAHLTSFTGTDTVPAIGWLEDYYNADSDKELVGGSVAACYDDKTEILTNKGWKLFKDLDQTELVAQYNKDRTIEFVKPFKYFKDRYQGKMIKFNKNGYKYIDIITTPNHKMVRDKNGQIDFFEAGDFSYQNRNGYSNRNYLVISGKSKTESKDLTSLERLKIAFQADGSFPSHPEDYTGERGKGFPIRFSLKKERKKERLIKLCIEANVEYKHSKYENGYYSFWINVSENFEKDFSWVDLRDFSYQKAKDFIEELQFWDGHKPDGKNCICYTSINKFNIDILQGIACLAEIKSQYNEYLDDRKDRQIIYRLTFQLNKTLISGGGCVREEIDYDGYVYCVSVPSKMIVVRRNNIVLICGNTEHSVACSTILNFVEKVRITNGQITEDELMDLADIEYVKRLITEVYPEGIVSIVADSFDYWNTITQTALKLKDVILDRKGKVVFRPDTGNPVKVVCGYTADEIIRHEGKVYERLTSPNAEEGNFGSKLTENEVKGSIECLWEIFGGTITATGYKLLDQHVGLIYGDSINLERAEAICAQLEAKGFASINVVYGIGSYTYQYVTRDTDQYAVKATFAKVDGKDINIYKKPKTGDGMKNSAIGLVAVFKDEKGEFYLKDRATWHEVENCELKEVYRNGKLLIDQKLSDIRKRLNEKL